MLKTIMTRALALALICSAMALLAIEGAQAQLTMTSIGGGRGATPAAASAAGPWAASVDLSPFVAALEPLVAALVTAAVGAAFTWACATVARWVGAKHALAIDDGHRAALKEAAEREANVLVAAAADNLAHRSIDVGSPAIASAASLIAAELPAAIAKLGITPAGVERLVVAAIGKAQTSMTRLDPAALPPPKAAA